MSLVRGHLNARIFDVLFRGDRFTDVHGDGFLILVYFDDDAVFAVFKLAGRIPVGIVALEGCEKRRTDPLKHIVLGDAFLLLDQFDGFEKLGVHSTHGSLAPLLYDAQADFRHPAFFKCALRSGGVHGDSAVGISRKLAHDGLGAVLGAV